MNLLGDLALVGYGWIITTFFESGVSADIAAQHKTCSLCKFHGILVGDWEHAQHTTAGRINGIVGLVSFGMTAAEAEYFRLGQKLDMSSSPITTSYFFIHPSFAPLMPCREECSPQRLEPKAKLLLSTK